MSHLIQRQIALFDSDHKTDRNDAGGLAQMMRVGLYRPVHVKTLRSQKLRMLLTHRQLLLSEAIARYVAQLRPQGRHAANRAASDFHP